MSQYDLNQNQSWILRKKRDFRADMTKGKRKKIDDTPAPEH